MCFVSLSMQKRQTRLVRKLIHLLTGLLILMLTYLLDRQVLLYLILVGLAFSFLTFNYKSFRTLHQTPDSSLGTLFYPLGVLSALLLLYDQPIHLFRASLMVLTLADPMANLFGQIRPANGQFMIWHDKKSILGMLAFTLTTAVILIIFLPAGSREARWLLLLAVIMAVAFELISYRGSDNLTIPFGLAVFFTLAGIHDLNPVFLSGVLLAMTAGSYLLFRWGVLTRHGSLMAWVLGVYFIGVLGHHWIQPVLFFFVTSVLFTFLHSRVMKKRGSGGRRNVWQVLANILWAVLASILFLVTRNELFIFVFISLVAAVTADTWASELGPLFNRRSFCLADLRWHAAGVSGGISVAGTLAALLGSLLIAAYSYWLFFGHPSGDAYGISGYLMIAKLTTAGFLACFADTLLGAFLEPKLLRSTYFLNKNGAESISPNDLVNLLGSATAPLFLLLMLWLG